MKKEELAEMKKKVMDKRKTDKKMSTPKGKALSKMCK